MERKESESAGDFGEVWDTLAKYGKLWQSLGCFGKVWETVDRLLEGGLADWTVRGLYTDANGLPA